MPTDIVAKVGDHDFHVVSLTPSVTLCVEFDGTDDTDPRGKSFYKGTAHVCLKDSIFQPSHAERHAVELRSLLDDSGSSTPILFVMTDGGPDHNCKHLAVQLSWLGLFLLTGMDMLVVSRVAPTQSWSNPAERVMSVLNLALQNMALARSKLSDETFEASMRRCNGMNAVRALGDDDGTEAFEEPLAPDRGSDPPLPTSNHSEPLQEATVDSHGAPKPMEDAPVDLAMKVVQEATVEIHGTMEAVQEATVDSHGAMEAVHESTVDVYGATEVVQESTIESQGALEPVQAIVDIHNLSARMELDSDSDESDEPYCISISDNSTDDEDLGFVLVEDEEVDVVETVNSNVGEYHGASVNPMPLSGFKAKYRESIKGVMRAIEGQMRRATWCEEPIKVHAPAKDEEVDPIPTHEFIRRCNSILTSCPLFV